MILYMVNIIDLIIIFKSLNLQKADPNFFPEADSLPPDAVNASPIQRQIILHDELRFESN